MSRTTGREDGETTDDDWDDRHARIEQRRDGRPVQADQSGDDWEARHSRTKNN